MRGMQASGLPVYAEGLLHCSPYGFLFRIFHIFVLVVALALGSREPPVVFLNASLGLNSFLQRISSVSYTPRVFLPKHDDRVESLYPFIPS